MAISTKSSLNSLFANIYEDSLFVAREQNLMTSLVRNFEAQGWMTRNLATRPQLTAVDIADGTDYANPTTFGKTSLANLTPGEVITQVVLTDQMIDTDPASAVEDASLEMGGAIATKIDTDLVGEFTNFTTDKGTANTALTIAKCAAAVAVLRNRNIANPIYFVLHPYGWHDVWVELGQPGTNQLLGDVANEAMRSYFVGTFLNAEWFTNSNISVDGNADAISAVFSPQALGFDSRKPPTLEPERDASLRAWELNMTAGYAHGAIRTNYGVKLTHDATEPS